MHPRDLFDSEGLRWQFFVLKYTFSFSAPIKDEMDIWHQEICHLDLCKLQFQMSTHLFDEVIGWLEIPLANVLHSVSRKS